MLHPRDERLLSASNDCPVGHATTAERPMLAIFGPVLSGVIMLAAGFASVIGGAALISVSAAPDYEARLVAAQAARPVVVARGGRVASVHVRDGDTVTAGQVLVRLDIDAMIERGRRLRLQIELATRRLRTARLGTGVPAAVVGDDLAIDTSATAPDRADDTPGGDRILRLTRELDALSQRLAETDLAMLHTETTAAVDGQVTGIGWLAAGAELSAQSTIAEIQPRARSATLAVAVPVGLASTLTRADAHRIAVHARARSDGRDADWPVPATLVTPAVGSADAGPERGNRPAVDATGIVAGTGTGIVHVTVAVADHAGLFTAAHRPGDAVGRVTFETGETRSLLSRMLQAARPIGATSSTSKEHPDAHR